jgi:hypothetical protein
LIDVAAVNDEIERDGGANFFQPFEDAEFLRVGFCAGDFFGGVGVGALKAELDVVEAGFDELRESFHVQGQAGGDEVDVKAGGACGSDEIENVGAGEGFAAGEVGLENAQGSGLLEDAGPGFGGKFGAAGGEFEGIRAVDAVEGAAVGEFGDEGEGIVC